MTKFSQLQASWPLDAAEEMAVAPPSASARRLMRIWAIGTIALMLVNLSLAVWYVVTTGDTASFLSHQLLLPLSIIAYVILGVTVINSRPRNPIGWLFLTAGTAYALTALASGIIIYGPSLPSGLTPGLMNAALWLESWVWLPATILPTLYIFLLFPSGRLSSPRWRLVAWALALGLAMVSFGLAFHPGPVESWMTGVNPYGLAGAESAMEAVVEVGSYLLALGAIGSILAIVLRFRCSRGMEREQMKLLAYMAIVLMVFAAVTIPLWLISGRFDPTAIEASIVVTNLTVLAIAAAAAVAIVSNKIYDIDILINRTLVYGIMTGVILLIYGLVVGAAGIMFGTRGDWRLTLLATGLVALLFEPVRNRLQRGVNRLLYGRRNEPFEVISQLGQRLEQTITPDTVYPTIVETVAEALRLPYVAIEISDGGGFATAESYGRPADPPVAFPLSYQGETIGRLLVGRRAAGEAFSRADEHLLRNIARQAGTAVYDARLAADLQRSRQQIVTSREEERRRLRRDLHDGLGPSLASLLLQARALRRMISDDPARAETLADEMQGDIRAAIDDIRRVVHELRPPALDDLGLVPAITVLAAKIGRQEDEVGGAEVALRVQVDAPADLPPLPAAVEVAAYRIIQEALTNVIHHARARCAVVRLRVVRLRLDHDLLIEVVDDGVGIHGSRSGGLGLHSMHERAAELGGRCSIELSSEGGTIVRATLPVGEIRTHG